MPFKDKTGPEGRGPRTGRGLGPCTDSAGRPKVNGTRGGGRGRGRGLGLGSFVNNRDEAGQDRSKYLSRLLSP